MCSVWLIAFLFLITIFELLHTNIIRFCNRPFTNVKEMGEFLLDIHNQTVRPSDHVSFLGDVTLLRDGKPAREWFVKEIRKYHGHKRLYLGNHDHWPIKVYLEAGFEKVYGTWRDDQRILYSHIPIHPSSMGTCLANVHGHIHQNPSYPPVMWVDKDQRLHTKPYINVSCEVIDYRPISHEEIMAKVRAAQGEYDGERIEGGLDGKAFRIQIESSKAK